MKRHFLQEKYKGDREKEKRGKGGQRDAYFLTKQNKMITLKVVSVYNR